MTWHMIGHIQTNKMKLVPGLFDYVHSVDRHEVLEGLDRFGTPIPVLFEVNLSGEATKHGTTGEGLRRYARTCGRTEAPSTRRAHDHAASCGRPRGGPPLFHHGCGNFLRAVNREFGMAMKELSMGMSADFEVAIEEGATMVRVGTAIFGERS